MTTLLTTPTRVVWSALALLASGSALLLWAGVRLTKGA